MSGAWMSEVLAVGPTEPSKKIKMTALGMIVLGVVGLGVGFASGTAAGLTAFLTATVLILGLAAFGPLLMWRWPLWLPTDIWRHFAGEWTG